MQGSGRVLYSISTRSVLTGSSGDVVSALSLIRRVLAHARDFGYRQVIADCTHAASRRSFETCGFHEAGFLSYETFSVDGIRYFAGLDGGISLMVRDL